MGSKRKKSSSSSNIDRAQLEAMANQQRLADEARIREQEMIQQQTAQQSEQFNSMLGVYQAQQQALQESKAQQEAALKELEAQQAQQLKGVQDATNREDTLAKQLQSRNIKNASRSYGVLSERRAKNTAGRSSVFGTNALPTGYNVNKGIM